MVERFEGNRAFAWVRIESREVEYDRFIFETAQSAAVYVPPGFEIRPVEFRQGIWIESEVVKPTKKR